MAPVTEDQVEAVRSLVAAIPPGRDGPESAAGGPISTPRAEAPAAPSPVPAAPPDRVRIPALDVDATVTPVGVAPDGEVEVPGDVPREGRARGVRPGGDHAPGRQRPAERHQQQQP